MAYWPSRNPYPRRALTTNQRVPKHNSHLNASMISGARYHRVATYSVILTSLSGAESNPLLRPKSQIFSSQSAFTSRFPGLRSL